MVSNTITLHQDEPWTGGLKDRIGTPTRTMVSKELFTDMNHGQVVCKNGRTD